MARLRGLRPAASRGRPQGAGKRREGGGREAGRRRPPEGASPSPQGRQLGAAPLCRVLHLQAAPLCCLLHSTAVSAVRHPHLSTPSILAASPPSHLLCLRVPLHLGPRLRGVLPSHLLHLTTVPPPQHCHLTTASSVLVLASRFPLHPISPSLQGCSSILAASDRSHTAPALHPRKSLKQPQRDPNKTWPLTPSITT